MPPFKQLTIIAGVALLPFSVYADKKKEDPIEQGLRDAFAAYQDEDLASVKTSLAEVLKAIEEKEVARVGETLPDKVDQWEASELEKEDLKALGGGISVKRTYTMEPKSITAKVVMHSPLVDKWIELLGNRQALKFTNKKVYTVDGEAALVENDQKILIGVDQKILVELVGDNDTDSRDIIAFVRKLGLKKIKELK